MRILKSKQRIQRRKKLFNLLNKVSQAGSFSGHTQAHRERERKRERERERTRCAVEIIFDVRN